MKLVNVFNNARTAGSLSLPQPLPLFLVLIFINQPMDGMERNGYGGERLVAINVTPQINLNASQWLLVFDGGINELTA